MGNNIEKNSPKQYAAPDRSQRRATFNVRRITPR